MVNTQGKTTTTSSPQPLGDLLDKIATKYITTMNFEDLANLESQQYCDNLVIITSKIFEKFLDEGDIKYLEQRMEKGKMVDKMDQGKLVYFVKNNVDKFDVKSSVRKRRMCIGIARYYVKIGHIFSAILKTLNPEYTYKDAAGNTQYASLLEKIDADAAGAGGYSKIKGVSLTKTRDNNFCSRRIKALTPKKMKTNANSHIRVCGINQFAPKYTGGPNVVHTQFNTEIGIPELEELYMDEYDFGTGRFTQMSDASKKQYQKDVATFYKAFTGKTKVPTNITSFSQIPLANFQNQAECQKPNGELLQPFDNSESIFVPYAKHLKKMMNNATTNQNKLIAILNKIFAKEVNSLTRVVEYTLQPNLTNEALQAILVETRNLIIQLYTQCEIDFRTGIKLFKAVMEKKQQQ